MIDLTQYRRRATHEVRIGACTIGGTHPVAVQSMTNTDTRDTAACVAQIERIARAGAPIVRLTAQGVREAENLRDITERLRADGNTTALVADIHFLPEAAAVAAQYVDKVRINPGNYRLDRGELEALVARCRERGVALRIGVNHGSLSKRIFDEWGDTPEGMVAAAMEFLHVCRREAFDQVVVSMKSSNTRVMVAAYRLLVEAMEREGMTYPIHLGVTEAGNGLEGRIKSAVGIGALLADGIGDTIRVSLTEAPENEIPVARLLADHFRERPGRFEVKHPERYSPTVYRRRSGVQTPVVRDEITPAFRLLESTSQNPTAELRAAILSLDGDEPAAVVRRYDDTDLTTLAVKAAADLGPLFLDGLADGIRILDDRFTEAQLRDVELMILQAARVRFSHTEYIACPSCGRTLYDIEGTLAQIKADIYEDFGALDVHTIAAGATNDHIDAAYQPMDEEAAEFERHIREGIMDILALQGIEDTPVFTRTRISNTKEQVETVCLEAEWLDEETILRKLPNITPDERAKILERKQREQEERMAALPPALAANAKGAQKGDEDDEDEEGDE